VGDLDLLLEDFIVFIGIVEDLILCLSLSPLLLENSF
jgi:hypothetical protein